MEKFVINIELITETIFGSGQSVPGSVDLEVLYDEIGIPFFRGKTFKGKLRDKMENVIFILNEITKKDYNKYLYSLLGKEGEANFDTLKFSDCMLNEKIRKALAYGIDKDMFKKDEILNSLTEIRMFTSLNEKGVAETGSLRQFRVIKKGLIYKTTVLIDRQLNDIEKGIIAASCRALRYMGTMETRGKGEVQLTLLNNNKDVTDEYIELLNKEVRRYA